MNDNNNGLIENFYFLCHFNLSFRPVHAFLDNGLAHNTNDLSGDPYVNFLMLGVLEFPSYGLLFLVLKRFGRRMILVSFVVAGGVFCVIILFVPSGEYHSHQGRDFAILVNQ